MNSSLDALRPRTAMWIVVAICSLALHGALAAGLSLYEPPPEDNKVLVPVQVRIVQAPEPEPPPPPPEPEPTPEPPPPEPEIPRDPVVQADPPPPPKKPRAKPEPDKPTPPTPPPADPKADAPVEPPPLMGINLEGTATSTTGIAVPQGTATGSRDGATGGTGRPGPRAPTPPSDARDEATVPVAGITQAPELIHEVRPAYPDELKARGIEGQVVVTLVIGSDGRVSRAEIADGLHPDLDRLALRAARQLRFRPANVRGTAVAVRWSWRFTFFID